MSTTFSIGKRLHFHSSRSSPMSNIGGILSVSRSKYWDLHRLQLNPLGVPLGMLLRHCYSASFRLGKSRPNHKIKCYNLGILHPMSPRCSFFTLYDCYSHQFPLCIVDLPFGWWVFSRIVVVSYFDHLAYLIFLGFWCKDVLCCSSVTVRLSAHEDMIPNEGIIVHRNE